MKGTPADARLEYTQHSVAWPQLALPDKAETDEVMVGLSAPDGGTYGEMGWRFKMFQGNHPGVQMQVFGDGLNVLFDERILSVITSWRSAYDEPYEPDQM